MTSALFGILQLDRGDPLGYSNIWGLAQAWLQDAGGFGAIGLILYLLYALSVPTDKSQSEKLRVPVSTWMVWMAALSMICYAGVLATILMELEWFGSHTTFLKMPFAPPAVPPPPPGTPIIPPPPALHWQLRPVLLMIAGLFALLGICEPFARDLVKLRVGRIWALSKLGFKEAVRSRLYFVGLLILVPFLFRNVWMSHIRPADEFRNLVAVSSFAIMILILITALLLASFSIPNDIKNQTIYTVVTKPVQRFEVVLGRFFGYTALLTLALAGMTAISLLLINTATIDPKAAEEAAKARIPVRGKLEFRSRKVDFDGTNVGRELLYRKYIHGHPESPQRGIWLFDTIPSSLAAEPAGEIPVEFTFDVFKMTKGEENRGVYVNLRFVTYNCPQAVPTKEQGGEWPWANTRDAKDYAEAVRLLEHGEVLSASLAAPAAPAGSTANEADRERLRLADLERLRLADRLRHLAELLRAVGLQVREGEGGRLLTDPVNPKSPRHNNNDVYQRDWKAASALAEEFGFFEVRGKEVFDYAVLGVEVPSGLFRNARSGDPGKDEQTGQPRPRLLVYVKCESPGQMLGMADPDLYILEGNHPFSVNFVKGMIGLWCRLCILIGLAVACSTYLSGVLSLLVALLIYLVGYATDHLNDLAFGRNVGGGPFEAISKLVRAEQPTTPLADTGGTKVLLGFDEVFAWFVRRIQNVIPDVESFSWTHFVSEGFNINTEYLVVNLLIMIGYLLPWGVLAYYLMKSREVAA